MSLAIPCITDGQRGQSISASEKVFGNEFNETLVHQLVVAYLAGARSGTKAQKTRSEVSGGGAKPWRQKGSGRARAGTTRSPLWRGGGITFASKPRDYKQKLNKKMYRAAMRSIYSELLRQDRLIVVDDIAPSAPKTRELSLKLAKLGFDNALIITDKENPDLFLAARNIPSVRVCTASTVSPVALVNSQKIILTSDAVRTIEGCLG